MASTLWGSPGEGGKAAGDRNDLTRDPARIFGSQKRNDVRFMVMDLCAWHPSTLAFDAAIPIHCSRIKIVYTPEPLLVSVSIAMSRRPS
jgi:hypothetical protein